MATKAAQRSQRRKSHRSIRWKFLVLFVLLTLLLTTALVVQVWQSNHQHMDELLNRQAALALSFNLAIRQYIANEVQPEIEQMQGTGTFIPELMCNSYVARSIVDKVRSQFPGYILKFSSLNPRNPRNLATAEEAQLLEYFRQNPQATRWSGQVQLDGLPYMVHVRPRRVTAECLRCHGQPGSAPTSLLERYGDEAGFGYMVGDVMAMDTAAVPVYETRKNVLHTAMSSVGTVLVVLLMLTGFTWLLFRMLISDRLAKITSQFEQACECDDPLQLKPINIEADDEIGVLVAGHNALVKRLADLYASLEDRVRDRTQQLREANERLAGEVSERSRAQADVREASQKLHSGMEQLERFNRMAIGREGRMIELKREVNAMAEQAGVEPPYDLSFTERRHLSLDAASICERYALVEDEPLPEEDASDG